MTKGISNFKIERVFKEINNDDLNEKFLGVFPSEKINKFIMFEKRYLVKNIHLLSLTQIVAIKMKCQKKNFFIILLELME